jgi:hypothetical protein
MNRIIIICEGQTEQEFCNTLLQPHFSAHGITLQAPLIKKTMGGIANWNVLKREIETYLHREKDVLVTTLITMALRIVTAFHCGLKNKQLQTKTNALTNLKQPC